MTENPFNSNVFNTLWRKHFYESRPEETFDFISIPFFKKKKLPSLFCNIGQNHTKGIFYGFLNQDSSAFQKKVFLIYDVPEYFEVSANGTPEGLAVKKSLQYPGYLIDLSAFKSLENYMQVRFSKSTRYKLNKFYKRFHASFNIKREVLFGNVYDTQYNTIFEKFRVLLEKRFQEKGTVNNNLDPKEWNFYHDVALPMIREKKACLVVLSDDEIPIGITLIFIGDGVLFDAITVFDTDYSKFSLGYVNIMTIIDWGIQNGFKTLDFSKGDLEYKRNWCTRTYAFEYHVLYDKGHLTSSIVAQSIVRYFNIKQKLRERKVNEFLHRILFKFRNTKSNKTLSNQRTTEEISEMPDVSQLEYIAKDSDHFRILKKDIVSYLYLNNDHISNVELYEEKNKSTYIIQGGSKIFRLT